MNDVGFVAQIDGAYRVVPELLVGMSVEKSITNALSSGDACADAGIECLDGYAALGPRVEVQPWSEVVVGPWLGTELGALLLHGDNTKSVALQTTIDLGFDVRPTRTSGIGAYAAMKWVLTDPYVEDPYGSGIGLGGMALGLRVVGRF